MAAEARRLEALLVEDLRAELDASVEAELEELTGLDPEMDHRSDPAGIGTNAIQISDGKEIPFIPEVHMEGKPIHVLREQNVHWGDHEDANDYWRQFEQSVDPSTAPATPSGGSNSENLTAAPEGYWEQFEYNELADIQPLQTKRKIKSEPRYENTAKWGEFESSADYRLKLEYSDKLHFECDQLKEFVNENEMWGDHGNHDDYWKQFQDPDEMEDKLFPERRFTLNLKIPKGGTLKRLEEARMNSTRKPAQSRTQKADKNLITVKRSESQREYEPTVSDPFEYSSGWEYEALHAGRFERRSPSPSLSPPPSRPIPSNMRPNDPKPAIFQPESKVKETAIWDTIEQLLAASSTSPPYKDWSRACDKYLSDKTRRAAFPNPGPFLPKGAKCNEAKCVKGQWLGVCHHEVQKLFKGNGAYGLNWLRRERLRWHPDRFAAKIGRGKDQKVAREMAVEMFVLVQTLIDNYGKT